MHTRGESNEEEGEEGRLNILVEDTLTPKLESELICLNNISYCVNTSLVISGFLYLKSSPSGINTELCLNSLAFSLYISDICHAPSGI
jgi:hypothetical protein